MSDSLYTAAYILQIREKYRIYWETVQHAITACYWTAMVDVLTFPNGYVSPCFTLNAQDAQKKEFINQLSGLIFFFAKAVTSAASKSYFEEVNRSLPKSTTCLSVPADSVNKHNASEFLSSNFLAHDAEIREAVKAVSCHFSYRLNVSMKFLFLAMFSNNVIVKEHSITKEKVSH